MDTHEHEFAKALLDACHHTQGFRQCPAVHVVLDAIDYRGWVGFEGIEMPLAVD